MLPVVLHWGQSCIQREDGAFSKANCLFAHSTIKPRAYFDCSLRLCRIEFSVHTALPIAQAPAGVRRLQRAWIERKEAEPRDILKSDAFAPFDHSMTSSARPSSVKLVSPVVLDFVTSPLPESAAPGAITPIVLDSAPAMTAATSISARPLASEATRWGQLIFGIICMVMIANLQYGWTLFVNPIDQKYHWGRAAIQVAFTIFVLTETWLVPLEGYLIDKFGPRVMIGGSGVLVAIAWVINSVADSLFLLYVGAAIGGIGAGVIYGGSVGNALKWFPDRRGLAAGLTAAGFGAGSAPGQELRASASMKEVQFVSAMRKLDRAFRCY
jgi:hypothetical protein